MLLNRCQEEFEKDRDDDEILEKKQKELEAAKQVRHCTVPSEQILHQRKPLTAAFTGQGARAPEGAAGGGPRQNEASLAGQHQVYRRAFQDENANCFHHGRLHSKTAKEPR